MFEQITYPVFINIVLDENCSILIQISMKFVQVLTGLIMAYKQQAII